MVEAYLVRSGELADRLLASLAAGEDAGGELRGQQSASLLVLREAGGYGGQGDQLVDIPIYDHVAPILELSRCYELHKLSYFPSAPQDLVKITPELAEELKQLLRRRGFLELDKAASGEAAWGDAEIAAMERFMGWENYDNRIRRDDLIDLVVLADIRAKAEQ